MSSICMYVYICVTACVVTDLEFIFLDGDSTDVLVALRDNGRVSCVLSSIIHNKDSTRQAG